MCHYPNLYDLLHLAPIYDDRRPAFECCHLEKALTHFPFDTVERHIIQTSLFLGLWWNVKQDNYEILFFYYYYYFYSRVVMLTFVRHSDTSTTLSKFFSHLFILSVLYLQVKHLKFSHSSLWAWTGFFLSLKGIPGVFAVFSVLYTCEGVWGPEQLKTCITLRGQKESWTVLSLSVIIFDRMVWGQRHVKKGLRQGD